MVSTAKTVCRVLLGLGAILLAMTLNALGLTITQGIALTVSVYAAAWLVWFKFFRRKPYVRPTKPFSDSKRFFDPPVLVPRPEVHRAPVAPLVKLTTVPTAIPLTERVPESLGTPGPIPDGEFLISAHEKSSTFFVKVRNKKRDDKTNYSLRVTDLHWYSPEYEGVGGFIKSQWFKRLTGSRAFVDRITGDSCRMVTTLMQASETWDQFKQLVERALPPYSDAPLLALIEETEGAPATLTANHAGRERISGKS